MIGIPNAPIINAPESQGHHNIKRSSVSFIFLILLKSHPGGQSRYQRELNRREKPRPVAGATGDERTLPSQFILGWISSGSLCASQLEESLEDESTLYTEVL